MQEDNRSVLPGRPPHHPQSPAEGVPVSGSGRREGKEGREGGRKEGREGGRKEGRKGGREVGREGREGGREVGRVGGREVGRVEGGREREGLTK